MLPKISGARPASLDAALVPLVREALVGARRYFEHLQHVGLVTVRLRYGSSGRRENDEFAHGRYRRTMTGLGNRVGTLGDVLAANRRRTFVGRSAQIDLFASALDAVEPAFSVLHLHGPGGVGKTSLLDAMQDVAQRAGAVVVRVDGRDVDPSPVAVSEALGEVLSVPSGNMPITAGAEGRDRIVLLLDTYERLTSLDDWLRDRLLPRLPASTVTVLAGRDAPTHAWRAGPEWRDLLRVVSLRNLGPDETGTFLRASAVPQHLHDRFRRLTYGHPLGLSLLTDLVVNGGEPPSEQLPRDLVDELLRRIVDAVPTAEHRRALEVCALARTTTEPLLRHALGRDDVHELFDWLRRLSFIQAVPDGLVPHELARDVLDADLRWRDFAGYGRIFRAVREYAVATVRATSGRAQQRAIFDLKFLFRHLRDVVSPVDWDSWGRSYPDQVRPGDRETVLDLVTSWEGPESATLVERWLDAQPQGFFVLRDHEDAVTGMLAILNLSNASQEDVDADPGTCAAWRYAQDHAPPRAADAVTQVRFVVDRKSYQGPSPTLNATPILQLQHQLATPRLSWDFVTLADPDRWNDYFAAADLPRAEGADFTIGGRRFGLFAHDFRQVPIDAWTEVWTERALAQDVAAAPTARAAAPVVLSHEDFDAAVRQALRDLKRSDLLGRNPLLRTRLVSDRSTPDENGAAVLEKLLGTAVLTLADHPRDDKLLQVVERTYLRPAKTQEAAAASLGLPFSTYRRHLTRGVGRVVSWLWDQELYGGSTNEQE